MKKYLIFKRIFDILAAYIFLLFCYFPMLIIAIIIKMSDGGPVIFKQMRIGLDSRPFICYKFRTMATNAPSNLSTKEFVDADKYVTKFGAFLRKTSLDELPQLLNVLAGDMSLIGPRPLIPNEKFVHSVRRKLGVYTVRPGISGLAQVSGRDELDDILKIECDAMYVDNVSLKNDLSIAIKTVVNIFNRKGFSDTTESVVDTP